MPQEPTYPYADCSFFGEGTVAMSACGSWAMGQLQNDWPDVWADTGIAAFPSIDGDKTKTTSTLGGWTLTVDAKSDQPQAAADFISWLLAGDPAIMTSFFDAAGYSKYPVRVSVNEALAADPVASANTALSVVTSDILPYAKPEPAYPWDISLAMGTAIEKAMRGGNIDEALAEANATIDTVIAAAGPGRHGPLRPAPPPIAAPGRPWAAGCRASIQRTRQMTSQGVSIDHPADASGPPTAVVAGRRRWRRRGGSDVAAHLRDNRTAYLMIAPMVVLLGIFVIWPLLYSFYLSTFEISFYQESEFVGLQFYRYVLESPRFWNSLWVGFKSVMFIVPATLILSFLIAALIKSLGARLGGRHEDHDLHPDRHLRGRGVGRVRAHVPGPGRAHQRPAQAPRHRAVRVPLGRGPGAAGHRGPRGLAGARRLHAHHARGDDGHPAGLLRGGRASMARASSSARAT